MAAELLQTVDHRLRQLFGEPSKPRSIDPLELLIRTILSQNTSDRNRDKAYATLRRRFPRWEDILAASTEEVAMTIRAAGMHHQRAQRIRAVLSQIKKERGSLTLDFLAELPAEKAEEWLLSLPGVGKKTAYIVLLFAFGQEKFPVDTHIARVSRRLGLWDGRSDPHKALALWVPPGRAYSLHLNLIRLGREYCRPRRPRCSNCPVLELCPYGQRRKDDAS